MTSSTSQVGVFLSVLMCIFQVESILVQTPSGPIRGMTVKGYTLKEVDAFFGIPYAEPPVGNFRFAPPLPVKPWSEEFDARNNNSVPCYGLPMFPGMEKMQWSEDCLKIHIWVPKPKPTNSTVMVYIHGGGFISGDPLFPGFTGETLAAEENIIVVSMNYRLHVQGFLYFREQNAPGNAGLLDQQMALKWVRQNIASFGGNPNDVTLFGMSAGGASVGFQIVAPNSRGLFHRAILMSGVPNAPWAFKRYGDVLTNSMSFAHDMGCNFPDNKQIIRCLETIHPENYMKWDFGNYSTVNIAPIGPTFDGKFIPDYPLTLLRNNTVNPVDIMIGTTADEGSFFMLLDYPEMNSFPDGRLTQTHFYKMVERAFKYYSVGFRNGITSTYSQLYLNATRPDTNDTVVLRDMMKDMFSDFFFNCPSQQFADIYSEKTKKPVYRYVVDHPCKAFNSSEWMGTIHGTDTVLHFGIANSGPPSPFTPEDANLSKQVMKLWANFARTGNPNVFGQSFGDWPVSTTDQQEYLQISLNPSVKKNFRKKACNMLFQLMQTMFRHF